MIDRACISLSNVCNLKCRYCHFQDKQQIHNRFSYEDLVGVVTNIHDYAMKNNVLLLPNMSLYVTEETTFSQAFAIFCALQN